MRRWVLIGLALPLLAPSAATSRDLGGGERAFVAAEDDDVLVAVDLDSPPRRPAVVARLRVPPGPHNVSNAVSVRTRGSARLDTFLLVTSPPAGSVTVVAAHRPRIVKVFRGLAYPHDAEIGRGGRFAYVTEERGGRVAVLDLERGRIVRRVGVGPGPHDLAVSRTGGLVWVTHGPGTRHLTVLNTRRPTRAQVFRRIAGRQAPHDITVACNGRRVWLTYWDSGTVGALDSRSGKTVFERRVGSLVHHVQVDSVGRDIWTTDHVGNRARLLNGCNGRVLRTLRVGRAPHHVAVGQFAGHVVVASHDDGVITVLRRQCECVRRLRVGAGLHGVAVVGVP